MGDEYKELRETVVTTVLSEKSETLEQLLQVLPEEDKNAQAMTSSTFIICCKFTLKQLCSQPILAMVAILINIIFAHTGR